MPTVPCSAVASAPPRVRTPHMPERQHSPTAAEAEVALQKQYNTLYAQLSMQAQHRLFSGNTLSGRGAAPPAQLTPGFIPMLLCLFLTVAVFRNGHVSHLDRCFAAEPLYEQSIGVNGTKIAATTENPFLRFAKTQRLPSNLAP